MLQKTRGIVLNYVKFRESSIIVKIYTEELGLQSYLLNGIRTAKSKSKMALFQPLTLLDLVVYHRKDRHQIFRISEVKCSYPYQHIPFEVKKSTIILFLAEILSKCLKEESANHDLFQFIYDAFIEFDQSLENFENFHLKFLIRMSRFLGFEPQSGEEIMEQLFEGKVFPVRDDMEQLRQYLDDLIQSEDYFFISTHHRRALIDFILDFYRLHVVNFDPIKSLDVLREMSK
jgi:DNA repair protein RecO (recombination protein O)